MSTIVIDATPLQTDHRYRGIGTYTAGVLDALTSRRRAYPLGLLAEPHHPDDLPLLGDLLARDGVSRVALQRPRWRRSRLRWFFGQLGLRRAVRGTTARVFHATDPNGLAHPPGVATVVTLYDFIPLHNPVASSRLRRLDDQAGYARYLHHVRRATRLIAISEATKWEAVERLRIAPERITVTPLAVDERRFYPRAPAEVDQVVRQYQLRRPYFLYVGSSDPHKNAAALVRGFDLFSRQGDTDHSLVIAGKWPHQAIAALHARYGHMMATGRLRMLGFVPEDALPALYSGATAYVYPSLIEGFGLPVLEAMRCATPVLTSNTSSLPEVGGDAVLYVDPQHPEEIAAAMRRIAEDTTLRADLVRRGLRQAASFTWARTAEETWRVYTELL